MTRSLLSKKTVAKTNNWYTAHKVAVTFGKSTGLPVRIKKLKNGKRVVVTDRILWENEGSPSYRANMPKKRAILGRNVMWF